ncbi:MAG: hypothetical protein DLM69_00400 [Candidatus Chloroheliales bacterium]|nr:MAG: hypothetical protein DLM69_00400 [Chloroflexota bacterium]
MDTYYYNSPMARLSQLQVTSGGSSLFNRSYDYDPVGNVQSITNNISGENQSFGYDPLDRLSSWNATNVSQQYNYDPIGNLTAKAGVAYTYGSNGNGTGAGPHQARTIGGQSYSYDANGNMTSSPGRGYTWNAENQLTAVTGTASESYTYDGDGERASRTVNGITTVYLGPLLDVDNNSAGTRRNVYMFNGQAIAQRTTTSNPVGNTLVYLHGDQLGSVSLTTSNAGSYVSGQEFDPWGAIRSGGVNETKLNYTGQRKDDTGLLYYHARYYNPVIARFISADTVVPGMAMGAGGALGTIGLDKNTSMKGLTVDYHEPGINSAVAGENQSTYQHGFWFQLSKDDKQKAKTPYGPLNPQALNRYSYVLNNPLRYTDPTGHYDYQYTWDIGPASSNFTPEIAMAYMIKHPQDVFPFGVIEIDSNGNVVSGETTLKVGSIYKLANAGGPGVDNWVKVTKITPYSFTFEEIAGGFDPVGSTITFSIFEMGGEVYLHQDAHTKYSLGGFKDWLFTQGAAIAWMTQADNLRRVFFPPADVPYYMWDIFPPYIGW